MTRRTVAACLVAATSIFGLGLHADGARISLNPAVKFQTFAGWESVVLSTVRDYMKTLPGTEAMFEQAATDLGITRLQIAVTAGMEHPAGWGQQYIDGTLSERDMFHDYAYTIVNDNSDPKVANLAGFDFAILDWQMERLVLPFRRHLQAAGLPLYAYLSYTDFGESKFEHYDHPDEYAEFLLVLFDHLKAKYDFVPDAVNAMNEPDQTPWTADLVGRAIAKAGPRLAAAGYHPDFIAPSTVDRAQAVPYLEDIWAVRAARPFVKELSYHCYKDSGTDSLARIAGAAVRYGLRTTMNECWGGGNTYDTLHRDLKIGRNSAWQQATFSGVNGYYEIDPTSFRVSLRPKTKLLRQYIKYIRPGATRIDAATTDAAFDPLAFVDARGSYVVVIKADAAGSCTIDGLPPATYGISYTTDDQFDVHLPDVTLGAGENLTATIRGKGVITVYTQAGRDVR